MKKILLFLCVLLALSGCKSIQSFTSEQLNENTYKDDLWVGDEISDKVLKSNIITKNNYSLSFWYKPDTNKPTSTILTLGDKDKSIVLSPSRFYNDNKEYHYDGINLNTYPNGDTVWKDKSATLKANRFNHIGISFNEGHATIYLNGELVVSGNFNNKISTGDIYIGHNPFDDSANDKVNGYYSDFKIFNGTLNQDKVKEEFKKGLPKVLLDTVNISESDDMIHDYWVDGYTIEGYPVKWVSDNQEVIDFRGVIMKKVNEDTQINLKATLEIDGFKAEKTFKVYVRKEDDNRLLVRDLTSLDTYVESYMHSNTELPLVLPFGSKVTWSVSGNGEIKENKLIKTSTNPKENLTLNATVVKNDRTMVKTYQITCLDEIEGYVMSYFNGELGEEKGYLGYSYDGLHWTKLNTSITTDLGTTRIRDPKITRDKDGNFIILATEGFDNPNIYIIDAPGLLDFTNQKLVQVAFYDEGLKMTGQRAWAPEMSYDMNSGLYYIYFSDNGFVDKDGNAGGPIYAVTSKDLNDFSYPYIYFNPGYSVIDGTIENINGYYWLLYKDERKAAQTIFYSSSNTLSGFNKAYDDRFLSLIKYMEGPFVFTNKDGGYFLYMDNYPKGKFYAATFTKLGEENDIKWFEPTQYQLPEKDVRHGSVIEVTKQELDKIIDKYK